MSPMNAARSINREELAAGLVELRKGVLSPNIEVNGRKLKAVYAALAAHTRSSCRSTCQPHPVGVVKLGMFPAKNPHGCCERTYCDMAAANARRWGVDLVIPENPPVPRIPLMGKTGCICPPHYRPVCTRFTCNTGGGIRADPLQTDEWNAWYRELVDHAAELEDMYEEEADSEGDDWLPW